MLLGETTGSAADICLDKNIDVQYLQYELLKNRLLENGQIIESDGRGTNNKTGTAKAIRFSTLEAICEVLNCQPGDILEYAGEGK
jgi:putative transcriptional regulator